MWLLFFSGLQSGYLSIFPLSSVRWKERCLHIPRQGWEYPSIFTCSQTNPSIHWLHCAPGSRIRYSTLLNV
uniref:Putative ovule protein n=1 Tax=Solanum chacoense TaxID=4108 RepID=A0A0V0GQS3_SOLCH